MSSAPSLAQLVANQLGTDGLAKAMFGEYAIYYGGVLVARAKEGAVKHPCLHRGPASPQ